MRHHSSAALSRRSESGIFVPTNPAHCSHLYLSLLGRCLFTLVVTHVSVLTWVLVRSHDCLRQRDSLHEHRGPSPSLSLGRKKRLSQESAVGVRWLLVLSVCLLAVNHCESTTATYCLRFGMLILLATLRPCVRKETHQRLLSALGIS